MFLSKNGTSGERTKCIDIMYQYVRKQMDKGLIEVQFFRSEDTSGYVDKNLGGDAYKFHSMKLIKE